MSYVITPSEKARAKTNPQPVGLQKAEDISTLRLILKNIFGSPLVYLQFLVFLGLLCSNLILEASVWLLFFLGLCYFFTDLFGDNKELDFSFSGFEWFFLLFGGYLFLITSMLETSFLGSLIYYRWLLLILVFPQIFKLFPGMNKFLYLLIYGGLIFALFGIVQHFTGIHPFSNDYPVRFSFFTYDAYAISSFLNNPVIYGLVFAFISSFVWAYTFLERKETGKTPYLHLIIALIFFTSLLLTYDFRIWILSILALLIPTFFISKKYFLFVIFSIVIVFYLFFWFLEPFRSLFLDVQVTFNELKYQMEITHINWFESIEKNTWFGTATFNSNIFQDLLPEASLKTVPMQNAYLMLLKQIGVLGFIILLFFFLQALLLNLRLLREVPRTHIWHKVLIIGTLCMQINMHLSSLFFPIFNLSQVTFFFVILLSILIYFDYAYGRGIVPDDSCL